MLGFPWAQQTAQVVNPEQGQDEGEERERQRKEISEQIRSFIYSFHQHKSTTTS